MLPAEIAGLAALATIFAQSTTNAFRKATAEYNLPGWSSLLVCYGVAILSAFLLTIQTGAALNAQSITTALLAGLAAGMGSVGITEFTKSASPNRPAASPTVTNTAVPLSPLLLERAREGLRAAARGEQTWPRERRGPQAIER